jgi:hypothetical protein
MTAQVEDRVLDLGLNVLDAESTAIYICAQGSEPTSIAVATGATSSLGFKSFGAGGVFGSPAAGSGTSRKVSSTSVSDGTINTSGTAAWWAVIASGSLHAHGSLASNQVVTAGNTFTLGSFDISIPNH